MFLRACRQNFPQRSIPRAQGNNTLYKAKKFS